MNIEYTMPPTKSLEYLFGKRLQSWGSSNTMLFILHCCASLQQTTVNFANIQFLCFLVVVFCFSQMFVIRWNRDNFLFIYQQYVSNEIQRVFNVYMSFSCQRNSLVFEKLPQCDFTDDNQIQDLLPWLNVVRHF